MTTPLPRASRLLLDVFHPVRPRPICECLRLRQLHRRAAQSRCQISTATSQRLEMEVEDYAPPRWSQTPEGMAAPVKARLRTVSGRHDVNKDPKKVDEMYRRMLGEGGGQMLSDETKWLAITHKSFDHGRRGFNDRLAFIGTSYDTETCKSKANRRRQKDS
jgi:hypothetical protein